MTTEQLFKKWRLFAPLGLTLIGLGISIVGKAIGLKMIHADTLEWFLWGTLGLVVTNAGIAVFGDAVKCRVLYELRETNKKE
jgi:hypothetical protein